jgi:hypothetical protein
MPLSSHKLLATTRAGDQLVRKANALGDALNLELLSVLDEFEIEIFDRCLAKLATWRPKEELRLGAADEGASTLTTRPRHSRPRKPYRAKLRKMSFRSSLAGKEA